MTKDEKAQANAWLAIGTAGFSLLIAIISILFYIHDSGETQDCNTAYAAAQNKAQQERIPYLSAQSKAIRKAFDGVEKNGVISEADAKAVVISADAYSSAQDLYPYPTSSCPEDMKGQGS